MNRCLALLQKVHEYSFVATDLQLFLDTHPDDPSAYEAFKQALENRRQAVAEYESCCGPLTIDSHTNRAGYDWLETPWPWE